MASVTRPGDRRLDEPDTDLQIGVEKLADRPCPVDSDEQVFQIEPELDEANTLFRAPGFVHRRGRASGSTRPAPIHSK